MASISEKVLFIAAGALLGATAYMAVKHPEKLKELVNGVVPAPVVKTDLTCDTTENIAQTETQGETNE